ncbi:hypothetical protein [Cyclobacterium plantarum]|uniref:hypothetical protein n=1 Tax=Cyclobacterium plantarum TaxID=2716263 RepID=UPI003F72D62C
MLGYFHFESPGATLQPGKSLKYSIRDEFFTLGPMNRHDPNPPQPDLVLACQLARFTLPLGLVPPTRPKTLALSSIVSDKFTGYTGRNGPQNNALAGRLNCL